MEREGKMKLTQSQNICQNKRTAAPHEEEAESCPVPSNCIYLFIFIHPPLFLEEKLMKYSQAAMQDSHCNGKPNASISFPKLTRLITAQYNSSNG